MITIVINKNVSKREIKTVLEKFELKAKKGGLKKHFGVLKNGVIAL
jgi:hypothetical protein